jgi:HTH-type transcriptional regulator / antitoxin HipB
MHDRSSPEATPPTLASTLRQRREQLGLNQVDVAELAGCSARFVHTLEAGKGSVRLDKLTAVLHVLGLRLRLELASGNLNEPRRTIG